MGITSLKNKINKRIMLENDKNDYTEIGAFIKKRRKDLNLTQDIISNGICSVSYLSKIENGQIVPNDFFVREIMTKLEIEEDFLSKNLEDKTYLEKMIRSYFFLDESQLEEMFEEIKDINDNLTINLCKFGYFVSKYDKFKSEYIISLENLVMNMSNLELKVYLYLSTLYFISNDDYKTALELLLMSYDIPVKNEFLDGMINEYTFYVKQRLLKKNSSLTHFDEAQRIYTKYMNTNRLMNLVLNKVKVVSSENPNYGLKLLKTIKVTLLKGFNKDFYHYLKASILFQLDAYNDCVINLSNIKEDSVLFISKLVLLYEVCLLEEDQDMLDEIRLIVEELKLSKKDLSRKVRFNYLTQKDEENRKMYLRDIAIPFSIKTSDFDELKLYIEDIMDICIKNSRYKEATTYYKKYMKEMCKIEKILYTK